LTARQPSSRRRLPTIYRPRTVFLGEHKTSVRLPPVMWEALEDIARHLGITLQDLMRRIERGRERDQGLTDAIRIYIVEFYRARIKL
jgi:predicted DNA-binding ribbon-helix-helix protein